MEVRELLVDVKDSMGIKKDALNWRDSLWHFAVIFGGLSVHKIDVIVLSDESSKNRIIQE